MRKNQWLAIYWAGFRAAKDHIEKKGMDSARKEYRYGLQGKHAAYAKGWQKALQ